MYYSIYKSKIGDIKLYSDGKSLTNLYLTGQSNKLNDNDYLRNDNLEVFIKTKKWLDDYFSYGKPSIKIDIKLEGTTFQRKIWNILLEIPYGSTLTYKDVRDKADSTKKLSCQAVGNAIKKNPISIIVPCHRVIGTNNQLIGYNGGIKLKEYLLNIEKKDG